MPDAAATPAPAPAPKPVGPYTPAVRAGGWLICSGQIGLKDGALVAGGTGAEAAQAIANLRALLAEHDTALRDVVKTTVFIVDMADYGEMNAAYTDAFGDHRPARSAVAVAALPLGAKFEVEAWAWVG